MDRDDRDQPHPHPLPLHPRPRPRHSAGRGTRSRAILALALALAAAAPPAHATTEAEAIDLCRSAMTEGEGATDLQDIDFRWHDGVPYVYGNARFEDGVTAHFRCRVYHEQVTSIRYLVGDPEYVGVRAWSAHRPNGYTSEGIEIDEAAKAAPAPAEIEPHFETVPGTATPPASGGAHFEQAPKPAD